MKYKTSDVAEAPPSADHERFVRRMARVFILAAFFVMTSQNLMAPNLTAVAASFGLDKQQRDRVLGGWMSTAFFLVGGPCSLVVGYLVDVSNRKRLFVGVMLLGNAVILLNAFATEVRASPCFARRACYCVRTRQHGVGTAGCLVLASVLLPRLSSPSRAAVTVAATTLPDFSRAAVADAATVASASCRSLLRPLSRLSPERRHPLTDRVLPPLRPAHIDTPSLCSLLLVSLPR
jgi:MFS family permease